MRRMMCEDDEELDFISDSYQTADSGADISMS